ncbi:MAG: AAA family ATPase [Candidatus Aminicenantes bacterium]|nr:MAG: AAA family ATPase [Candidatus Aminicenantes bacterium]
MAKEKKVKRIPYGLANYERVVQRNCYYVDKTMYLRTVEEAGDYLFFIRPRRFGKSLFLAVMEAYYDVYYKDRFEELFKGTEIYNNPTGERGTYLVLKFNFSMVNPALDKVEDSFLNHVQGIALSFVRKYANYLVTDLDYYRKKIEQSRTASDVLFTLKQLCMDSRQKSYALIDEYDNFANTILSTAGEGAYRELTHGEGFFRAFFNVLKGGTDGMGAPFSRLFLTGVSPITLDDVTSGFNIGKNISLESHFSRMLGFTRDDVSEMIEYYRSNGLIKHPTAYLLDIITQWYGNYQFCKNDDVKLFNSDMVLYFIDNYITAKELPDDLIDRNVRVDYKKLRHLIVVDRGKSITPNGNFNRLQEIIEQGGTSSKIEKGFPLEKLAVPENFKSLLFYLGLLTIEGPERDKLRLKIPNETVRHLYYDYIVEAYRETNIFDLDLSKYADLMTDMAYDGKWESLFDFITGRMRESMSLRDLITGEKSIQAFLNVYLGLSNLYIIHPEKELNKGFADIVMEPFVARYEGIKYSYLLEIKYIKTDEKPGKAVLQQLISKAGDQLQNYSMDAKFKKNIEKTTLVKLVLIFCGHELMYKGDVKQ